MRSSNAFANPIVREPTVAPWTWSTLDPEITEALQDGLRNHGVRPELCQVGNCSAEERDILETVRGRVFERLMQRVHRRPSSTYLGDATRCHGCGMGCGSFFRPLKKCARCNKAFYHSRDCQKKHWAEHKAACHPPADAPSLDAYAYYNTNAPADPGAQALMRSLKLELRPPFSPLGLPLRRLIVTGQDTPNNMKLLFGPQWESHIKKNHEETRIEYLLDPPPGSPSYVMNNGMGNRSLVRSLRPANEAEQQTMDEVREMQALIRGRISVGTSPSSDDMQAILTAFGADWSTRLPIYALATNTIDQGVPSGGCL